jgi:hypothetical protein
MKTEKTRFHKDVMSLLQSINRTVGLGLPRNGGEEMAAVCASRGVDEKEDVRLQSTGSKRQRIGILS